MLFLLLIFSSGIHLAFNASLLLTIRKLPNVQFSNAARSGGGNTQPKVGDLEVVIPFKADAIASLLKHSQKTAPKFTADRKVVNLIVLTVVVS